MDVPNFPDYLIFRNGSILSKKSRKFLKQNTINTNGYKIVSLHKDRKQYCKSIHRLLGLAFLPNPENKRCIDHIDRNKLNNKLCNLRWASHSENNYNVDLKSNNKTGIRYLCWCNQRNRWRYKHKRYVNLEDIPFPENTDYSHLIK